MVIRTMAVTLRANFWKHLEAVSKLHRQRSDTSRVWKTPADWTPSVRVGVGLVRLLRRPLPDCQPSAPGGQHSPGSLEDQGLQVNDSLPAQPNRLATRLVTQN